MSWSLSRRWKIIISFLILIILCYLSHFLWLPFFANFLVVKDNLERSDVIIVLGTDTEGMREDWAAILYKRGLAEKMIICGYQVGWRASTAEIMKRHAVALGVPNHAIILDYGWNNHGTWDNAINSLKIIKERNFKSAIVVTSPYHTRRSRYAFNKVFKNQNVRILISQCQNRVLSPFEWWKNREHVKAFFLEYIKLIYYFLFPPNGI